MGWENIYSQMEGRQEGRGEGEEQEKNGKKKGKVDKEERKRTHTFLKKDKILSL